MAKRESPLMQELGPKKYQEKVEKASKFYDDHKAGKRDPKTGEYYNPISFSDPSKPKTYAACRIEDMTIGHAPCSEENCSGTVRFTGARKCSTCFMCGKVHIRPEES